MEVYPYFFHGMVTNFSFDHMTGENRDFELYLSNRQQVPMVYLSNRPQVSVGYKLINHAGC